MVQLTAAATTGVLAPKDKLSSLSSTFTISPALQSTLYDAPVQKYLSANPTVTNPLASAAVFFRHPHHSPQESQLRLLLLQRAPTDTLPLKWELPGGSVDLGPDSGGSSRSSDFSVIHGAVRELHEETGLVARQVVRELGVQREFYEEIPGQGGSRRLTWRMVIFEVDVDFGTVEEGQGEEEGEKMGSLLPKVKLEPGEHARYLWCTEEDIRAGWCDGVELELTHEDWRVIMLRAFELHREGVAW